MNVKVPAQTELERGTRGVKVDAVAWARLRDRIESAPGIEFSLSGR